ncbi:hypothetical protein PInf_017139 [Phytophthora infestans]|nr:hypothetical protein PInf_017139 [Phytophthora infestans]
MTIGRDLMTALGLGIDFKEGRVQWDSNESVVRTTSSPLAERTAPLPKQRSEDDDEFVAEEASDDKPADRLPQHLDAALQHCYLKLLEEYFDLCSGRLGRIRLDDYILLLRADYAPAHARPYGVPGQQ